MADTHHHAARHDERRRGEAEFLRAEQGGHDDVPARLDLAVHLHDDAVAQAVADKGLLGLGEAELPRHTGVLQRGERRRTRTAVLSRDEHHVGMGLGDAGGDGADTDFGDELHVDARTRVGVLQVVDELGDVLDRVDVVMRRWRDEPDARSGVARAGDPRVHLVSRELPALAWLGTLGDLDLQVVGIDEVLARHPETPRGHLLHRRAPRVPVRVRHVAFGVLPSLTGVGAGADAVHGDGEGFVGLGGDGPVRHRPGGESPHDLRDGLDLVDRHRWPSVRAEPEQASQRRQALGLRVHERGVLLEHVVAARSCGVLQLVHGARVEQVVLAVAAPLVLAADLDLEVAGHAGALPEGSLVTFGDFGCHLGGVDPSEAGRRPGEVAVDEVL